MFFTYLSGRAARWSRSGPEMLSLNLITVYTRFLNISKGIMNAHSVMEFIFNFAYGWVVRKWADIVLSQPLHLVYAVFEFFERYSEYAFSNEIHAF